MVAPNSINPGRPLLLAIMSCIALRSIIASSGIDVSRHSLSYSLNFLLSYVAAYNLSFLPVTHVYLVLVFVSH